VHFGAVTNELERSSCSIRLGIALAMGETSPRREIRQQIGAFSIVGGGGHLSEQWMSLDQRAFADATPRAQEIRANIAPSNSATSDTNPASRPFEDCYGEYVVRYKPQPTPDGRYLAYAIVSIDLGVVHTLGAVTPDLPSFSTQSEAADQGWGAGTRWIDSTLRTLRLAEGTG
jgi:hypothetical protein